MYNLIKKVDKVKNFKADGKLFIFSDALYLDGKKINEEKFSWAVLLNSKYISVTKSNKKILLNTKLNYVGSFSKETFFVALDNKNQNVFLTSFDSKFQEDGNILFKWILYDVEKQKNIKDLRIENSNPNPFFLNDNYVLFQNLNTITSYNLENGEVLWERKEENGHNNIIGVFQDAIFLPRKDRSIISISIDSGDIIQTWRELPNINKGSKIEGVIPEPKNFVLDKENELLVGRGINTIITIDLKTNNISFVNIDEELKRHNIFALKGISKGAFNSTHLFLTGMMNQTPEDTKFSYDCLFALNRETLQIDWQYNFEEEALGTHKPVLSGNKLYQLDNNKTLHIFEKEEHIN